ncbi:AF4/FMR2 family member 3 [Callorhinchus milii]|uniref:AF4/FMR2 family member 3 n=1 Tax=Callorhinchus milii TaxID=7868 RepID=UPI001C3FA0AB|nr:AF4/FMR2 family member 3 [Callorhinchus milii]
MDIFDLDILNDWDLETFCVYEQDRNALRRKEWERRNQEAHQLDETFNTDYPLFSEPYKTNKGDELSSRIQNTLGNYDEMKDLLTDRSNQSHLVGIPKTGISQTPIESIDQHLFQDSRNLMQCPFPSNNSSTSTVLPPLYSSSPIPPSLCGTKSAMDLAHKGQSSGTGCNVVSSDQLRKNKHGHGDGNDGNRVCDSHSSWNEHNTEHQTKKEDHGNIQSSSPTSHSSQNMALKSMIGNSSKQHQNAFSCDVNVHCHTPDVPTSSASTTHAKGTLSAQSFPQSLSSKSNAIQQKPTAYVRPMDGQDQAPNESPELKQSVETVISYSDQPFGELPDAKINVPASKAIIAKLTIPQAEEAKVGGSSDNNCVEEILREMTHSWPPPLTAIHTPSKVEPSKFLFPAKDSQHVDTGYNDTKKEIQAKSPSDTSLQKLMLEDDLKISSDEEENEQQMPQKSVLRTIPESDLMHQAQVAASGHSNAGSSSSSGSESSSESDSESESSSSDSDGNKPASITTPEPEQPSTNKWQLDKWLNKVNPRNKNATVSQNTNHGLSNNPFHAQQQCENEEKGKALAPNQTDFKEKESPCPNREKQRPRTAHKTPVTKGGKQKPLTQNENASQRKTLGKKQPSKAERASTGDDFSLLNLENHNNIPKGKPSQNTGASQQHKPKPNANKAGPKKEPQTTSLCDKRKPKGPGKNLPKSKEFIDTESSSSSSSSSSCSGLDSDHEESLLAKCSSTSTPPASNHILKDCSSNLSRVSSCNAVSSVNARTTNEPPNDSDGQLFTLVPFGRNELLSQLKENEEAKSLWVKIDLTLLSRIPGHLPKESLAQKSDTKGEESDIIDEGSSSLREKTAKSRRKRKSETNDAHSENKKNHLENEPLTAALPFTDNSSVPTQKAITISEMSKQTNETVKEIHPSLSSVSDISEQKHPSETSTSVKGNCDLPDNSSSASLSSKDWKSESKAQTCTKDSSKGFPVNLENNHLCCNNQQSQENLWSSASKEFIDSRRPKLIFDDKQHRADYYMQEAKRMKHQADAMVEKFGKAINYIDAALSFIECGNAMEQGPLEAKSPYTMYSETVELIRYAMRLKAHSGPTATLSDKQLAALCYRCLALLYWRMFRLKRDNAVKYSKALIDYFKCNRKEVLNNSIAHAHQKELYGQQYCSHPPPKLKAQAHTRHCCSFKQKKGSSKTGQASSPWGASGKNIGTSSPMSPSPSPVSSVGSHGSSSSTTASSPSSTINIPHRIHQLAANHVNITNSILYSYDYWEMADKLAKENKEFFHDLDIMMGPVTLHSSMTHLVRYTQQGLHWIRISTHML